MSNEQQVVLEAAFVSEMLHLLKQVMEERMVRLLDVQNRDATKEEENKVECQAKLVSLIGYALALELEQQVPELVEDDQEWSNTVKKANEHFSKRAYVD